eukprot:6250578-Alexandrium_andersonii.AAC.1
MRKSGLGRLHQVGSGQTGGSTCHAVWEERPPGRGHPLVRSEVLRDDRFQKRSGGATGGLGRQIQRLALLREGRLSIVV